MKTIKSKILLSKKRSFNFDEVIIKNCGPGKIVVRTTEFQKDFTVKPEHCIFLKQNTIKSIDQVSGNYSTVEIISYEQ